MKTLTLDLSWINKLKLEDLDIVDTTWEDYHGSRGTNHEFTVYRKDRSMFLGGGESFSGEKEPSIKQIKDRLKWVAIRSFVEENRFELVRQIEASIGDAEPSKLTISINTSIYP